MDVILDAIQSGAVRRVEAPTRRKDITPIAQEPDFLDQEDEPEVTLPEGYDEMDFDDRRKSSGDSEETVEADSAEGTESAAVQVEESVSETAVQSSEDSVETTVTKSSDESDSASAQTEKPVEEGSPEDSVEASTEEVQDEAEKA